MSLVNLANMCSQIQNASRLKLATTCIPHTKLSLAISLALQNQGFISSVVRGTPEGPDQVYTPTTQENVAKRRLWLGLKYYDNEPVLSELRLISKPTQRIWLKCESLEKIANGIDSDYVKGLRPGECIFLGTDRGVFDLREALERRIGGQLLCRAR